MSAGTSLPKLTDPLTDFSWFNNLGSIIWSMPIVLIQVLFFFSLLASARDQIQALEHVGKHSITVLHIPNQLSDVLPRPFSLLYFHLYTQAYRSLQAQSNITSLASKPLPPGRVAVITPLSLNFKQKYTKVVTQSDASLLYRQLFPLSTKRLLLNF